MTKTPTGLGLWATIDTTDPVYVREKKASGGRKESTPNPQYQIKRITEQCGPVGVGWGYMTNCYFVGDLSNPESNPCVVAEVAVWTYNRDNTYGPIVAMNQMYQKRSGGYLFDDDAPKKAITDALTKALSHLGMSADIFMGMYDDEEYVASLWQANEDAPAQPPPPPLEPPLIAADVAKGKPMRTEPLPTGKADDFWGRRMLTIPVNRDHDGNLSWPQWSARLGRAASAAPSPALLEKLLNDNSAAFDALGIAGLPDLYNELVTGIATARRRLQPTQQVDYGQPADAGTDPDIPF